MRVAILGGGITGVTLASCLSRRGIDWELFEAAPRLGGLCRSETVDGFVADVSGGHIIFSKHRDVLDFIFENLGAGNWHETKRNSAIYWHGRYVHYPFENGLADLPPQDNFDCLSGYVDAWMKRKQGALEPENFEDWSQWRFGSGICDKFMYPYNRKLWKTDLRDLSTRWVRGRVPDAPIDDVLRASIGIKTEGYVHQSVFWYPMTGGFETLVHAVADRLDAKRIHVARPVRSLEKTATGWAVDGMPFDHVVNTIPLHELRRVVQGLDAGVAAAFDGLRYTSLATVFVACDEPARTDRSWVYFPHEETGPFNRLTHLSNYSPGNAPPGTSSLLAEVTYIGDLDNGEAFQKSVVRKMAECDLLDEKRVRFTRSYKNKYAYILYTHDLEDNLATIRGWAQSVGLDLCGRFGNYDYFNSDQCIKAAMDLAARLEGVLRR